MEGERKIIHPETIYNNKKESKMYKLLGEEGEHREDEKVARLKIN